MSLNAVPAGKNLPDEVNVIIEIPAHSDPVKYEVDKDTGAMFVDRFMSTAMHYPCNYGYVPHTLSKDSSVIFNTPIGRTGITEPANNGNGVMTRTSTGSPSSDRVFGT